MNAPIASGTVDDSTAIPSVRFTVDARMLSVKTENGVNDKDQAEVQSNMQSKVLESSSYPQIVFQSTHVRPNGDHAWSLSGDLTLHGATRPVKLDVNRENDAYVGAVRIKQTDFSIQPIKIGGGVVKVKDELEIHFQCSRSRGEAAVRRGLPLRYAASRKGWLILSRTLSSPRSAASWQRMHNEVHGTASRRRRLMSSPQCTQVPNVPSWIRSNPIATPCRTADSRLKFATASSRADLY